MGSSKAALDITFLNPLSFPVFLAVCLILVGFLVLSYYKFSILTRRHIRLILGIMRGVLVALVLFMILDPFWNRPSNADWMGVLIDTSNSMAIHDAQLEKTRLENLKDFFEKSTYWKNLQKDQVKKYMTFDEASEEFQLLPALKAKGDASKLLSAIEEVGNRYHEDPNLMGWIVFSDGAATDIPKDKKILLSETSVPWITVGMGLDEEVPNVRLKHPVFQEPIFVGDVLKTPLEWESNLPPKTETLLSIKLDGKPLIEKSVFLEDKKFMMQWMFQESGNHFLDISLKPLAVEGSSVDNHIRIDLRAHPRETRVFYAESFYKEHNYFKEALEEDESFKVSFVSSQVGFSRKQKVAYLKDPIYGFPKTRSELYQYDAVVLSDVKRNLLSNEQIDWIRDLVEKEGGAFVMVGGVDSFGDGGYVDSAIEKMLPVEISEDYKQKNFLKARGVNENPFRPVLTADALKHPIMQLKEDADESKSLWDSMPLLGGYNYVGRVKPGAVSLLEHPTDKSGFGPRPILAVQNFGKGKVLAFTSDVTPNWGEWFQIWKTDKEGWIYARFWRNTLKWLTENRIRGRASLVSIERDPILAETLKPITFKITLPEHDPLQGKAELKVEILKNQDLVLSEIFKEPESRLVSWKIPHLDAGDYVIKALYSMEGELPMIAETPFVIHPPRVESEFLRTQHGLLKQIAEETQGVFLPFNKVDHLEEAMRVLRKVHLRQRSKPFWTQIYFYLAFLLILFLDWFIRKKKGLE